MKIALVGNPNSGKSSLFNALTGLRQKVGNYPGVTVDRKQGQFTLGNGERVSVVDLPGIYGLFPRSEDEQVAVRVLLDNEHADHPDVVVMVVDVTNLRRGLLLGTQVMDLGFPVVLALNMMDLLPKDGPRLDVSGLSASLGVPVVTLSARRETGLDDLKKALEVVPARREEAFFQVPGSFDGVLEGQGAWIGRDLNAAGGRYAAWHAYVRPDVWRWVKGDVPARVDDGDGMAGSELAVRYDQIQELLDRVLKAPATRAEKVSAKLDQVLLHPVGGYLIFAGLLLLIFQAIFAWAALPMDLIDGFFGASSEWFTRVLPDHFLTRLFVEGIWAGLGGIVIFVPQIALLFFFISLLEDSGYMSRVVFLMDRLVRPFGFSGKSVIPLIGGMACAVPSIMMARTIPNKTERLITILVTPLMSCSARIPVYVLLISMFVPEEYYWGIFNLQGLVMGLMYLLGFLMALVVAWVMKVVSRYKSTGIFVTEIPLYRIPRWKNTAWTMYHKARTFVVEAGKVIMVLSVVLWLLMSYGPPGKFQEIDTRYDAAIALAGAETETGKELETQRASERLRASYVGMLGHGIEPVIRPLGFDWKIGIALISSFAAREVFVGTMATIYSAGPDAAEDEEGRFKGLRARMAAERNPVTGEAVYTAAVAMALLVFYAFAMQCMSTVAVVQRETKSWKVAGLMVVYMTGLAYVGALVTYQVVKAVM